MSDATPQDNRPIPTLPVAWLKPTPPGYTLPFWRWMILPATALMLKYYGGVWIAGDLKLGEATLDFAQAKAIPLARAPVETWSLPLSAITGITLTPKLASQTLEIHHSGGTHKLTTARADAFVARLRALVPAEK